MESAIESVQKFGVLLIGKTRNGKSSAGNKLLGKNVFKVGTGLSPITKKEESEEVQIFGKTLKVVDTPDFTNLPDLKADPKAIINKWRSMIASMPYIVLLAIKCNEEYSQTEFAIYQQIKEMWGDKSLCQRLVVLFTFGDRQSGNFCGELQTCTSPLRDVLHDAGRRYLIFSTKIHETRDLFHQFDNLCLSSPLQSMDQNDAPLVTCLSSSWEPSGQNEVAVVTPLSFSKENSKELDQNDTTVLTGLSTALEPMDHSDATVLTLEPKNQNDAIILSEGTVCGRDQQSLSATLPPPDFTCADNKTHHLQEAIECGFTPVNMNEGYIQDSEPPQADASWQDLSQSNTPGEICLLIIGKTGNGKSTGGNLLLSKHLFNTGVGLSSTTKTTQSGTGSFEGRNFKVIDTPDIFNQEMFKEDEKKEIEKWKQMVLPEPYVILLAVRCDVRYSPEEFSLYQRMKELWGEETFCKYLMVLFTFGDRADREIEQELKIVCQELKNVLKDAQGRYIVLSEKADFKSTQNEIKKLFKLVKSDKDTLTSLPKLKKMKFPNIWPKSTKGN